MYSDPETLSLALVVSFDAPLELSKSSTSKFVSAPAFAFTLPKKNTHIQVLIHKQKKGKDFEFKKKKHN